MMMMMRILCILCCFNVYRRWPWVVHGIVSRGFRQSYNAGVDQMMGRQQFVYTAKQMGSRSWGSCKAFTVMGLIFSATECAIEKAHAKHDIGNTVVAGCVTGGALSAKAGPQVACVGFAGFASFSVLIEKFLERHEL